MRRRLDTFEINLDLGFAFDGPAAAIPADLGPNPLLAPPAGYAAQNVTPGPTRPGNSAGIANFLVSQNVSCVDPYNLYNRARGGMLWLAAYQLTVDESNGPLGGAVLYMGRPNQDSIPIRVYLPGEALTQQVGCIIPIPPGWVIYTRVQDAGGAPLIGQHKLSLSLCGAETVCQIACAIGTSQVLAQGSQGAGQDVPEGTSFQNATGGATIAIGGVQPGTVFGANLADTNAYTIIFVDQDGVEIQATLGAATPTQVAVTVDTTAAAAGTGEVRVVPADPFGAVSTFPIDFV